MNTAIFVDTPLLNYVKKLTPDGFKLICFHHAGGAASAYIRWQGLFGDAAEILPVQLPGREMRMGEDFITDVKEAAVYAAQELSEYVSGCRFAVFGHSMGGVIAYETVKAFERMGFEPEQCIISATVARRLPEEKRSCYLDDEAFLERVAEYGALGAAKEVLKEPEFRSMIIRLLRNDFNMIESYEPDTVRIRCPITAVCGSSDPSVSIEDMCAWAEKTEGNVTYREFEGGHFYLSEQEQVFCDYLKSQLGTGTNSIIHGME